MNTLHRPDPGTQSVLLDLDGTLVASRDGIVSSLRRALRDLGHAPDPARDLSWVIGPPLADSVAVLMGELGDNRGQEAIERYRHHYAARGMADSPLFPGIIEVLDHLAASSRRVFLATSKPLHLARQILEMRGIAGRFAALYGARPDDGGAEKPELIAGLVAREGVDPRRAVMVGDRRYDISGAHANGMRALGVLWGYGGRAELEAAGADGLVDTPADLVAAIERQLAP